MGEYPIYDAFLYDEMTADEVRNKEYRSAIGALVKDRIVLDLGTGKDMVWAMAAVAAGARKVYAIEEIESAYPEACARIRHRALELARGRCRDLGQPIDSALRDL
jgi:predicted nicotinamide N-methyase